MSTARLNPSTLIGIVASVALLVAILAFASNDPSLYLNYPGLAIVVGGTLAATFISYPLREVLRIFALVKTVFRHDRDSSARDIEDLVHIAQLWSRHDVRKVEQALVDVRNPFLRTGMQLVIDNTPEHEIAELLQSRVARMRAREQAEAELFRVMAGYAPAFGMLGTLVGLINLLYVLGDGDIVMIGQQMAIALMTTFYGILLANLICKPIAVKLERRTEQRVQLMDVLLQGVGMMAEKRSPTFIREALHAFTTQLEDEMADTKATATESAPARRATSGSTPIAR